MVDAFLGGGGDRLRADGNYRSGKRGRLSSNASRRKFHGFEFRNPNPHRTTYPGSFKGGNGVRGFHLADSADNADFAVMYSYSIGAGKTIVSSSPDFVWGGQKVDSSTTFPRYFQVSIVDVGLSRKRNQLTFSWQAEIYSSGESQNISWLADHFVPKLFENFGKTANNQPIIIPTTVPVL